MLVPEVQFGIQVSRYALHRKPAFTDGRSQIPFAVSSDHGDMEAVHESHYLDSTWSTIRKQRCGIQIAATVSVSRHIMIPNEESLANRHILKPDLATFDQLRWKNCSHGAIMHQRDRPKPTGTANCLGIDLALT